MRAAARELDANRVKDLMIQYRRSPKEFFAEYGGGPSTGYDLLDDQGQTYPPAAIVQAALGWKDIKGGLKHADSAGAALKANGFRVIRKGQFQKSKPKNLEAVKSKLEAIEKTETVSRTKIRVGTNVLREFILLHRITCEVSGIEDTSLLRVSHIVSWSDDKKTRLDPDNVILLSSLWDAAFDRGLVSFDDKGVATFHPKMSKLARRTLERTECRSLAVNSKRRTFLGEHRRKFGFPA